MTNDLLRAGANPIPTHSVKNPPAVPPQRVALDLDPVPLEVRRLRVANGSRRRRDLAAVRMAEELELLEAIGQSAATVTECWPAVRDRLAASVPPSTFNLWLDPLEPIGADGDTLILSAPEGIREWAERRYSHLIVEVLRDVAPELVRVQFVGEGIS